MCSVRALVTGPLTNPGSRQYKGINPQTLRPDPGAYSRGIELLPLMLPALTDCFDHTAMKNQLDFESSTEATFFIANHGKVAPIVIGPDVDQSVHIAVATFADDIQRVTGSRPVICSELNSIKGPVIEVRIVTEQDKEFEDSLLGKWESYLIRVDRDGSALAVIGSDKVGRIVRLAQSPARCYICTIHTLRAYGCFTVVLVERCSGQEPIGHLFSTRSDLLPRPASG